jgi:aminoglycoside phosphotransferase (APT) family kinase protein
MVAERTAPPGLDADALGAWLGPRLELDGQSPLHAELIAGGRSNLTYRLRSGERTWVLRRPPLGRRAPTAHSMTRERRVLDALSETDVPVPRIVTGCDDDAVIGAPFYVMDYVDGRVIRGPADDDLNPVQRHGCGTSLVRTLATLHQLDFERIGLGSFGRPAGYLGRQLERFREQLDTNRTRELLALDRLGDLLAASLPDSGRAAVLHGDYRIDNVLLDREDPTRIVAVVDWEMATLGDPLCDLGMLLMYWGQTGEQFATGVHEITAAPGFPTRSEILDCYAEETGFKLDHLDVYVAFAYFKLAVIVEGIHARHLDGLTVGAGYDEMAAIPPVLAEQGIEALG